MPEISRFFGIIIRMYANEHNPPHFHAVYGGQEAVFSIDTGYAIEGSLPRQKEALITAWAIIHKQELLRNWERLLEQKGCEKIKGLEG